MEKKLTRRAFLRRVLATGLGLGLAGVGCGSYARLLEPRWLDVEEVTVPLARLPQSLDGLTVGLLSDLHLGPYLGAPELAQAVETVQQLHPQLVVISGDFVSRGSEWQRAEALSPLAALQAPFGVFAVLGNHDHWTDAAWVGATVQGQGITVLSNSARRLSDAGQGLWLVGVDSIWVGAEDLPRALAGVPDSACKLLLVHEPDFADKAARWAIDLQLSGHSHGGQVRLPLLGAPLLPLWGQKYPIGLQRAGDTWVYTNRGLGVIDPPLRFNCRPEVTLLTLRRASG
ncbi:MAG: metallophosphoesterase [Anaerolineae bacterium]|nr:metallophosphoesterase [Anaerolineae bacterium]